MGHSHPQKMPAPDWNEMMRLSVNSKKNVKIDVSLLSCQFGLRTHLMGQRIIWSVTRYLVLLLNQ